jgi:hypothetical protein
MPSILRIPGKGNFIQLVSINSLDFLIAAIRNNLSPAPNDQRIAKATLRHLGMTVCVPPNHDRIGVGETGMNMVDHQ